MILYLIVSPLLNSITLIYFNNGLTIGLYEEDTYYANYRKHLYVSCSLYRVADAGSWYAGSKFGWSHYGDTNSQHDADFDRDNVGGGIFTGYQINPWLAVEGGYDYLGNMGANGNHGASGSQMKSQGLQVSLKASYGLSSDWDLYGRAGVMGYRAESDIKGHNDFDTGIRPVLAVGTEYAFNENWAGALNISGLVMLVMRIRLASAATSVLSWPVSLPLWSITQNIVNSPRDK